MYDAYYPEKLSLSKLVLQNKDKILKKIPVHIDKLEEHTKKIVKDNLKKRKILKLNQ